MTVYGYNGTGGVPWTGYSNTLGNGAANAGATAGSVQFNGLSQGDDRLAKMFRNGGATLQLRQVMSALLGAAVGGTAVKVKAQIQGQPGSPGGAIPIETVTIVNRTTTANDVIAMNALLFRNVFPTNYAPDLSGNGGGGKQTSAGGGPY